MLYKDSNTPLSTAVKILKVNHAGEFGAIQIYQAQIAICRLFMPQMVPLLNGFMEDEKRHLDVFMQEIHRRNGVKCKSYWLCGAGGFVMGAISALLGKNGIMACTWAVESVVAEHLNQQILYLDSKNDAAAREAVQSILDDEVNHRDISFAASGSTSVWYTPLRFVISTFTKIVIRFGMR